MTDIMVDKYTPIRNQTSKSITAVVAILLFATYKSFRVTGTIKYGILDYWRSTEKTIPNDYKLLLIGSILVFISLIILFLDSRLIRDKINSFVLGVLGFLPAVGNFLTMIFFFYIIFYRGLWTLSELQNGFQFIILVKTLIFTSLGLYGYRAFVHLHKINSLLKNDKIEDFKLYADKYKLNRL